MTVTIDRRVELEQNLAWLTSAIENCDQPSAVASLARERRITLAELAEVPARKGSTRDEIANKRVARRTAASAPEAPTRRGNKRSG